MMHVAPVVTQVRDKDKDRAHAPGSRLQEGGGSRINSSWNQFITQAAPEEEREMQEGAPGAAEAAAINSEEGGVLSIPPMQAEALAAERQLEGMEIEAEVQREDIIPAEEEEVEEPLEKDVPVVAAAAGVPSTSPPPPSQKSLLDIMRIAGKRYAERSRMEGWEEGRWPTCLCGWSRSQTDMSKRERFAGGKESRSSRRGKDGGRCPFSKEA